MASRTGDDSSHLDKPREGTDQPLRVASSPGASLAGPSLAASAAARSSSRVRKPPKRLDDAQPAKKPVAALAARPPDVDDAKIKALAAAEDKKSTVSERARAAASKLAELGYSAAILSSSVTGVQGLFYDEKRLGAPGRWLVCLEKNYQLRPWSCFTTAVAALDALLRTAGHETATKLAAAGASKHARDAATRIWRPDGFVPQATEAAAASFAEAQGVALLRTAEGFLCVRWAHGGWCVDMDSGRLRGTRLWMSGFQAEHDAALAFALSEEGRAVAAEIDFAKRLAADPTVNISIQPDREVLRLLETVELHLPGAVWLATSCFTTLLARTAQGELSLDDPCAATVLDAAVDGIRVSGWSAKGKGATVTDATVDSVKNNLYFLGRDMPEEERAAAFDEIGIPWETVCYLKDDPLLLTFAYAIALDTLPGAMGPNNCDNRAAAAVGAIKGSFDLSAFAARGIYRAHAHFLSQCSIVNITDNSFGPQIEAQLKQVRPEYISLLSMGHMVEHGRGVLVSVRDLSAIEGISVRRFSELLAAVLCERVELGVPFKPKDANGTLNPYPLQCALYTMLRKEAIGATEQEKLDAAKEEEEEAAKEGGGEEEGEEEEEEEAAAAAAGVLRNEIFLITEILREAGVDTSGTDPEKDTEGKYLTPFRWPRGPWVVESYARRQTGSELRPLRLRRMSPAERQLAVAKFPPPLPVPSCDHRLSAAATSYHAAVLSRPPDPLFTPPPLKVTYPLGVKAVTLPTPYVTCGDAMEEGADMAGVRQLIKEEGAEKLTRVVVEVVRGVLDAGPEVAEQCFSHLRNRGAKASGTKYAPRSRVLPVEPEWRVRGRMAPPPTFPSAVAQPEARPDRVLALASRQSLEDGAKRVQKSTERKRLRGSTSEPGMQVKRLRALPEWGPRLKEWGLGE